MKFALAVETSEGIEDRVNIIVDMSNELNEYFSIKDYGNDLIRIVIGTICVSPEFEFFSKIRKPKYVAHRKYINQDGIEILEDKVFSFDLKLDYETFKNQSDEENKKMLASEIIDSLSNLDALPKKVKDFDKERFKNDMKAFFEEQKLLVKE